MESVKTRCSWAEKDELSRRYHDEEWGIPVYDDQKFFEMLVLEYMQAGLSWSIVLKKREAMREAFDQFQPEKIARYTENQIAEFLENEKLIRNKRKLATLPKNAQAFLAIQAEFGSFQRYIWKFVEEHPKKGSYEKEEDIPTKTPLSEEISKDMKKRGFSFLGPVTVYAFLQATGIVNNHVVRCFCYSEKS